MAEFRTLASVLLLTASVLTPATQASDQKALCAPTLVARASDWWNHVVFFRAVAEEALTQGAHDRESLSSFLEHLKLLPEAENQKIIFNIEARIQQLVAFTNSPDQFSETKELIRNLGISAQTYAVFVLQWRAIQSDSPDQVRARILSILVSSTPDFLDGVLHQIPRRRLAKLGRREMLTNNFANALKKAVASFLKDQASRPETRSSRKQGYYDFVERMAPLSHDEYGALAVSLIEGAYNEMSGEDLYMWLMRFQNLTHSNRALPLEIKHWITSRTNEYFHPEHGPLREVLGGLPALNRKPSILDPFDW